jgi:hypothetical protein
MTAVPAPVPDTLSEACSPQWLTAALQPRFPGVEVTGVIAGPIVDRVSTNARIAITCAGGLPTGLPGQLCIKGYFNEIGRTARSIGEPEAHFYRDLAPHADLRTLRPVYADVDQVTRHGVVVTADVVADGGRFLDGQSIFTPDEVARCLSELARLHARTWMQPSWSTQSWLAPRMGRVLEVWGLERTTSVIAQNLHGPNGHRIPTDVRDEGRLIDAYRMMAASAAGQPWCVIHGDPHVGNVFLDAAGRPGLLDWQLVQRGAWSVDVGYHIASALTVDDRRQSGPDLLRHYLDCLRSCGIEPPPLPQAWLALSRGVLHGFFLWAITTKVEPAIIEILLHRLGTAAAEFEVFSTAEATT